MPPACTSSLPSRPSTCTIRIPKAARGESLNVFLPWVRWRRPLRGGFHAWLTAVPQGFNSNPCLMKGRKVVEYHPPPHTHPQLTNYKSQQPATPLDSTFQMDLSLLVRLLPAVACLHLNSLHASCICSPLQSGFFTSEICSLAHQTPPDSKSADNFAWTHLFCTEQTCPSSVP